MRFMVMIRANQHTEAGAPMSEQGHAEMLRFSEELAKAGVLLGAERLHPSAKGARVRLSEGRATVTDGPFPETKELIAGFSLWEAASMEEVIEWIRRSPMRDAEFEIRPVFEWDDFRAELTPALEEQARRLGALVAAKRRKEDSMQFTPYLGFNGQCQAAFQFYEQCLDGQIVAMIPYGETPAAEHTSPAMRERIMHARLLAGDAVLMGGDTPQEHFEAPRGICVSIQMDDPARAERIFHALSEGGQVQMPFGETFWAVRFGMLIDRYGIPWMINVEKAA